MSELLKGYAARCPALRPLCIVLKIFLREQNLHRAYSGGLASVSLMAMAVVYLRQATALCHEYCAYMFVVRNRNATAKLPLGTPL